MRARRRIAVLAAGAALLAAGVALTVGGRAAPESRFSVEVLAAGPLASGGRFVTRQPEVEIDRLTLRPGGDSGWHDHDGPVILLVTRGALTNYIVRGRGCVRSQVRQGHTLLESAGRAHIARNEGTRDVVFYAINNYATGGTGQIDAERPRNCPV